MKKIKSLLLIVLLFNIHNSLFAQNQTAAQKARITDIKRMYQEVNNATKVSCEEDSTIFYDSLDPSNPDLEKFAFTNTAEKCELSGGYSVLKGLFNGYEYYSEYIYYYYYNQLFFVFVSSGAESCLSEERYYFDTNQNIIKYLNKSNDCDGSEDNMVTKEITAPSEINSSKKDITEIHQRILAILNQ
jgi:hypothetical protein